MKKLNEMSATFLSPVAGDPDAVVIYSDDAWGYITEESTTPSKSWWIVPDTYVERLDH
jgi:hypothetical protein